MSQAIIWKAGLRDLQVLPKDLDSDFGDSFHELLSNVEQKFHGEKPSGRMLNYHSLMETLGNSEEELQDHW